jgi:protein-disulfide isomerase
MNEAVSRSTFLRLAGGAVALLLTKTVARSAENEITSEMILADPEAPTAGNLEGDLTIVDFFDYNCPFCKDSAVHLERLVKADGRIRLVYKDWPVLAPTSIVGAKLALGARYQGKYLAAHHALMNVPGYGISQQQMIEAVRKSGVDMNRLDADITANDTAITGLLKRNLAIADAIGLQGTPGFLVGPYKVNQALNYEGFQHVVADARARQDRQKAG